MAGEKQEEKRRFKRFPSEGIIDIVVLDKSEANDLIRSKAKSVNMSVGGVLLCTDQEIPAGKSVLMKLDIDLGSGLGSDRVVEAVGRVVRSQRSKDSGYEIAVCFEGVTQDDADALRKLVNH